MDNLVNELLKEIIQSSTKTKKVEKTLKSLSKVHSTFVEQKNIFEKVKKCCFAKVLRPQSVWNHQKTHLKVFVHKQFSFLKKSTPKKF